MENRRINLKAVFAENNFKLLDENKKINEYVSKTSLDIIIYFYWAQGENGIINLVIDPRIPYLDILTLKGVSLQKTRSGNGLRFGTAMKKFPFEHEGIKSKDSQSQVGRMFSIQESALANFLNHLNLNPKSSVTSFPKKQHNADVSKLKNDSENNVKDELKSTLTDLFDALKLASTKVEEEYQNKPGQDVDAIVKRRLGQSEFRSLLEKIYGSSCHVSLLLNRSLLIASHIVPWSKSSPEEKTDPGNGLLLAINWDAVFDKGFICFDNQGKVIFSDTLDTVTADLLGIDKNVRLRKELLTPRRVAYLQRHRTEIFKR